ncbi:MAG: glycosyltransferase [Acidimicrobiales bacterium]
MSDLKAAPAHRGSTPVASDPDVAPVGDTVAIEAPPVVAVVVASDPGDQFEEMLASLGDQDYENLSVLVIDAGSTDPIADRVASVLPEAYLHRLSGDPGWSVAANQSIELVSGSPFLLFCHDDVALDDTCVSTLMGELYRRNAGIAGPKMVRWDDHRKLLQLGMGSDRFGVLVDQVERGEFDQEQYETVRDVFVAPGGVQLIRADLFVALGGFDPEITLMGEDLDLCWRAHAVGARVLAVSDASARHRESMEGRLGPRDRAKLSTRHRLRTVMVTSSGRSRFFVVPMAVFLIVLEAIYYLLSGRRGQARDTFAAIGWNLTRLGDIRRRRRALRTIRQRSDKEVRALQISGSAALNTFSRGQFTAGQDRFSGFLGAIRSSFQGEDSGSLRDATVIGVAVALVLAFASRHLLTRGVVAVGQIPIVPGASELLGEWWGGWRTTGTGGPGNPPSALPLLGLGRLLFSWAPGLFENLLVVGPVAIGVVGIYRLTRPVGSARSAAVASALYAASPLLLSAMSAGRWEAVVVYGAAPFLFGSLLRIDGVSPYGDRLGSPGFRVVVRSLPVLLIRYGFLVAFVATFAPSVVVVAAVLALAFALASTVVGHGARAQEFVLAAVAAVVAPVALHLPWSYDVFRSFSWRWLVGPRSPEAGPGAFLDLLLFAPGRHPASVLTFGILAVALLGLALAPRRLFGLATQAWVAALVLLGLAWFGARGWLPFGTPAAEVVLAPVAVAFSLASAIAVRSIELGDGAGRPRWLRLNRSLIALGVAAASLGAIQMSLSGRWETPTQSYVTFTDFLAENAGEDLESRVLWIGDASVVPIDVTGSGSGINYAVTDGGSPDVLGRWSASPVGRTPGIGRQLDLAQAGETVRLGRLLAAYGINLVVVVDRLGPAPYEGPGVDPGPFVEQALSQQLDLERVLGIPNLLVFRNSSSGGLASALPSTEAAEAVTPADQLDVDLGAGPVVDVSPIGPGRWTLDLTGDSPVLLSVPNVGLELVGDDTPLISGFDGMTVIPQSVTGEVEVRYPIPWSRRAGQVGQVLVVGIGAILAQTRRDALR